MKKCFIVFAKTILVIFAAIALYDFFIRGIFEKPSLNVDHFEAGAGSISLIFRFIFGILSVLTLIIWSLFPQKEQLRELKFLCALIIPFFLIYSVCGIQRFSSHYNEDVFRSIANEFYSGERISKEDVLSKLGEPLVKEEQTIIEIHRNKEGWLYSYMPSSGFGWDKRVLYFNQEGYICDINRMSEP